MKKLILLTAIFLFACSAEPTLKTKTNPQSVWEELEPRNNLGGWVDIHTARLKVPGGWVLRNISDVTCGVSSNLIFISDSLHQWRIIEPYTFRFKNQ